MEGISPGHSKPIVMQICWAKLTQVILKGAVQVIRMEDSSDEEEVVIMESDEMRERDEKAKDVEDHFHGVRDLVHIYQDAVRDRTQGALSLAQMLNYEQVSLKRVNMVTRSRESIEI